MNVWRCRRRWLGSWLVAAVLFTQMATAAYACPALSGKADAAADIGEMAGMPCAEAMQDGVAFDADQSGLCLQHCQFGNTQQPADPLPPLGVAAPALLPLYALDSGAAASAEPSGSAEHRRARERVPRPPHSILHCCYRI